MPQKPLKPCAYPNCPEVIREGRYCNAHKLAASRQYDSSHRFPDHNRIYGRRWRKIRDLYLSKHPLCEDCLICGLLVPADEVHHIVPPERGGSHEESNLRSLCKSCHTKTRTS